MISSLTSYWNYGRRYCGIEHGGGPDGELKISALTAIRKNGEFEIEKTFEVKEVKALTSKLKKDQHCFLCLTTKQVLLKATTTKGSPAKVISAAFPNTNLDDFYFELLTAETQTFVALCRKEEVHRIIRSYEEAHIKVIGFSLGFFSLQNLLPLLEEREFPAAGYLLNTNATEITSFRRQENSYEDKLHSLGDTSLPSGFLLALSALFNYGKGNIHTLSNFEKKNSELKKDHQQKVLFRKGLTTGISMLLLALLINFLVFSTYYENLQELSGRHRVEISQKETYDKKSREIASKEETVNNILNNSSSRSSFFLNRVVSSKPGSVLLSEFTFQPLEKQIKEKEPIDLQLGQLRVAGESANEAEFSAWIRQLEDIPWIAEVVVSDFSYSSPNRSGFIVNLNLQTDEAIH